MSSLLLSQEMKGSLRAVVGTGSGRKRPYRVLHNRRRNHRAAAQTPSTSKNTTCRVPAQPLLRQSNEPKRADQPIRRHRP
jgi:nitrate/nitrite-specific signal transduction histidine kinase